MENCGRTFHTSKFLYIVLKYIVKQYEIKYWDTAVGGVKIYLNLSHHSR